MKAKTFIKIVEEHSPNLPPEEMLKKVEFLHNGKDEWDESDDLNASFREEVVNYVFDSEIAKNRALIKKMLKAEIEYCREETLMTESLRKLTFMLYEIGEIEDIPLLFEAKKDTSFDAGIGLDIELIFGKDKEAVKNYFRANKNEEYDIVSCIEEYEQYDFRTPSEFIAGIKKYYGK